MKSEHKKMKSKAWKMFALYILLRDCNAQGICECCTCGEKHPFWDAKMQAGHFVSGRTNSVLFNEKIVHRQCMACNGYGGLGGGRGEQARYFLFMKKKGYTDSDLEDMLNLTNKTKQFKTYDLEEIIRQYHKLIQKICKEKLVPKAVEMAQLRIKQMNCKKILQEG